MLESEAKLPVELAVEREQRAARIKPAAMPLENLPKVRLPYRLWRAPALDFVVNAGVTYQASTGMRVDRHASVDRRRRNRRICPMTRCCRPTDEGHAAIRFACAPIARIPDGGLLGPLNATHFAVGDVQGQPQPAARPARAAAAPRSPTGPLFNPVAFDRTRFEGELPAGLGRRALSQRRTTGI